MLIKLFESEIKLMLKLQIGQILTLSKVEVENLTKLEFEHASKLCVCQTIYALLIQ